MAARMTDALFAERAAHLDPAQTDDTPAHSGQVSVAVAVNVVAGVDPQPTLEAVARQAYPAASVTLVGEDDSGVPSGLVMSADLEEVVASLSPDIDYVWILHGDAEPRPDALTALVDEAERYEASLTGSKLLVAGTRDTLEGVGSATDIFGEPYSGLDEGEVDLEQYDVVRDVAFVSSVSMLVRRDLLRGLQGLDSVLAPVAAGLDLSQRVRIAGGRVMVVPSSEVFHHRRCGRGDGGWREQAGRLRAMLKVYTPVTLAWMIPFAFVVGALDSLGSLLQGRWRLGPRYLAAWAWNLARLPSTLKSRRSVTRIRQVRDEELFRYQVRGSVRLRQLGSELSEKALAAFDDETALTRRASQIWNAAGAWGLVVAVVVVLVGVRSVFLGPLPTVGHSVPLLADARTALARFLGGWNSAGLGSDAPVHPATGLLALIQLVLLNKAQLARSVVTVIAFGSAVMGTARLAARLRIGGPGAYLGGVAAVFGPAAALLAGGGRWPALLAIGVLPWALSTVVGDRREGRLQRLADISRTTLAVGLVSMLVPALAVVPLLFAVGVRLIGRFKVRLLAALVGTVGSLAALPFLLARLGQLVGGVPLAVDVHPVALLVMVIVVLAGMVAGSWRASALAGVMVFGGLAAARVTGPDAQVALLVIASVGIGLAVSAALRRRVSRDAGAWFALLAGLGLVVVSMAGVGGGRAGMPGDQWGERLGFVALGPDGVERALLIAATPAELPGESRPGPGFWYRLIDSEGPTLDQVYLSDPGQGNAALREVLDGISAGITLRPGSLLAPFGVRWVVAVDEAAVDLGPAFQAQVDLQPLPLAEGLVVYDNQVSGSVAQAGDGTVWKRQGTGFTGPATGGRIRLALQGDGRWGPDWRSSDWAGTVSGSEGVARFSGVAATRAMTGGGLALLALALVMGIWGRRLRRREA